jgi:thioredoxin 1
MLLMDKRKLAQIIVPACIVLVIAGIWILKNSINTSKVPDVTSPSGDSAGRIKPLNDTDFALKTDSVDLEKLTAYGLPIIIDFGSDSCIPCKEMASVLQEMNAEMQGLAIIKFVDVRANAGAAADFPVQLIPTQVIFNADGTPYVPSDNMESYGIEFIMYSRKTTGEHAFTVHQGKLTEEEMRLILKDMGVISK